MLQGLGLERIPGDFTTRIKITGDEKSPQVMRLGRFLSALKDALRPNWPEHWTRGLSESTPKQLPHLNPIAVCFSGSSVDLHLDMPHAEWDVTDRNVSWHPTYILRAWDEGVTLTFHFNSSKYQAMTGWPVLEGAVSLFEEALVSSPLRLTCDEEEKTVSMMIPEGIDVHGWIAELSGIPRKWDF